jgi:alpha-L-rhamnosidase
MEKLWKAKWITDPRFAGLQPMNLLHKEVQPIEAPEHRPDLQNQHTLVRKRFEVTLPVGEAYLDISGDDYYKLYINGEFVGQGPAPGYHFHYYYNRIDVSRYLRPGANVIAVHLYYQGLINRVWNSGDYRQGMIAELQVNGVLTLVSDNSWKCCRAAEYTGRETFGYVTQYVEDIDSRLQHKGWVERDYDDRDWENASEKDGDDHRLVRQETPLLQVYELKPAEVRTLEPGHFWVDFGVEITGQLSLTAQGVSGQTAEIRYGEELEAGSSDRVRYRLRCNCNYRDMWTLSGGGDRLDAYDYKAFRYVELLAPPGVLQPESLKAIVRHYPFEESKCRFNSSAPLLNRIWEICKNGVKYGAQEVFVDCPSREKGQYLGDFTVTGPSHIYLTGDLRLYKKTLQDFALSARICPGLMAVAPGNHMQEIADFSLQWPLQLLKFYQHSGDLQFLREMAPVAEAIIAYFQRYQRADGLLENVKDKWNLVDWPENLRDEYDFDLAQPVVGDGCHNVINAFYCGAVQAVNIIRRSLGIGFDDRFPQLKAAFIKAFYREDLKLLADSAVSDHTALHSNFIALYFDLVPVEAQPYITALIRRKKLNCGVYNAYFLLKGLARMGEYRLVYELLTGEDEHSWANMIREGATTCFEVWGKDQKWNTSLCHPWASAPISVIIEDIIGIKPLQPGWSEVLFEPRLPDSLEFLDLEFSTVKGRFKVGFSQGRTKLETPPGVRVKISGRHEA